MATRLNPSRQALVAELMVLEPTTLAWALSNATKHDLRDQLKGMQEDILDCQRHKYPEPGVCENLVRQRDTYLNVLTRQRVI